MRACFLGERAGDELQALIRAWSWGSGVESLEIFINMLIDYKKTLFNVKTHSILDRITMYCMVSYTSKRVGAAAPPLPLTPTYLLLLCRTVA